MYHIIYSFYKLVQFEENNGSLDLHTKNKLVEKLFYGFGHHKIFPYLLFRSVIQKNKNHMLSHINACLAKRLNDRENGKVLIPAQTGSFQIN